MSEQKSHSEAITQYLLGALPEAEAERLDELSVTDQAFAEALAVAEKDLIDAYVQGELDASVVEQFKSHYLASPIRRERARFAEAFQVLAARRGAAEAAAIDSASRNAKPKRAGRSSMLSFFTPRLAWQWGLAAAVVILLVTGGWLVLQNVRLRQQAAAANARRDQLLQRERELQKQVDAQRSTNSAAEQELARLRSEREYLEQELAKAKSGGTAAPSPGESIVSLLLAPPLRGTGQLPVLSLRPDTNLVAMQLQLEAVDYPAFRVALVDPAGNQAIWRSGSLRPRTKGEGKVIAISFPARLLKTRNYLLRVTGISSAGGSEIISDYPFKVMK